MPSKPYGLRVPEDELTRLRCQAKEAGVDLSEAMRVGAAMYLALSPESRAVADAQAAFEASKANLTDQVERAKSALRSLSD